MSSHQETRSFIRKPIRTLTSVIVLPSHADQKEYRAWSDDISAAGMRICCDKPIEETEFYLRILLPELMHRLVKGRVVREESNDEDRVKYIYGVEFLGVEDERILEAATTKKE